MTLETYESIVNYDNGEWLTEWVRDPIERPNLALPLGLVGPTGTGKSNLAWGMLWQCALQGDCVIIPGDAACEFRHFFNYTKYTKDVTIKVVIPNNFEYKFFMGKTNDAGDFKATLEKHKAEVIEYDIYKKSINDFIEPHIILVVMDACFNLESKTWFWQYNLKQIKYRTRYNYVQVTYCFPEASTYWPNTPFTEQYKPVYLHSKDFVEFRKFFVRGIYIYHHSSMLFYLIEKQFETIIKKGASYENRTPLDNKIGRAKHIRNYTVVCQGIEDIKLEIKGMFQEMKTMWKIITKSELAFDTKHWEKEVDEEVSDYDKNVMLLDQWKQVQESFPEGEKDILITEFWKLIYSLHLDASIDKVRAITKVSQAVAKRCQMEAIEELHSEQTKNTSETSMDA